MASVPLAVAFTKHAGYAFLPPTVPSQDPTPNIVPTAIDTDENGISHQMKDKFRKFFIAYYEVLGRRAVRDHTVRQSYDLSEREGY